LTLIGVQTASNDAPLDSGLADPTRRSWSGLRSSGHSRPRARGWAAGPPRWSWRPSARRVRAAGPGCWDDVGRTDALSQGLGASRFHDHSFEL